MSFLIPSRTSRPGDDPIFALNAEAKKRAQAGEAVINATVGALLNDDGSLATLEAVNEAVRQVPARVSAGYAPIAGSPDFLREVKRDLLGDRPEASHAAAAATPGGTGALRHAIANFLEPGQALLTSSFYWGPYKTLADESDRKVETFNMFAADGSLDTASFRNELTRQVKAQGRALVLLNSPCHNPTGYSFDAAEWAAIAAAVVEASEFGKVCLLLDIAYAKFGAQPLDVMLDAVLPLADRALVLFAWSASKAFLEYGLRVGALLAVTNDSEEQTRIQNALSYSCRGTWSNINAGGMAAITSVLSNPERCAAVDQERAVCTELLGKRVAAFNRLAKPAGLRYPRYDGGFFTTVFCDDAPKAALALKTDGIFVVPQTGALRIALCSVAEADIERVVQGLVKHTS